MSLPLRPPLRPMLARAVEDIPPGMHYEPKFDGFRCLAFVDGADISLWSRQGQEMTTWFPEVVVALAEHAPERCVLDGEIVVVRNGRMEFTAVLPRIKPRPGAVAGLVERLPAQYMVWDLLAFDDVDLLTRPQAERRNLLVDTLAQAGPTLLLSPMTDDLAEAREWFTGLEGAGLEGIVAKPPRGRYEPGVRAVYKIKQRREADVVVGGYKIDRNGHGLGSLQLGLWRDCDGVDDLGWVGVCSGFPDRTRAELAVTLEALAVRRGSEAWVQHPWSRPGPARRPSADRERPVVLVEPVLVCEVEYGFVEGGDRFRTNTRFLRWRPDKAPEECRFDQVEIGRAIDLGAVLDLG